MPSERVPAVHRAYVERHVARACRKLRLPRAIEVRYFEPMAVDTPVDVVPADAAPRDAIPFLAEQDGEEPGGFVNHRLYPGVIAVNAHLRGEIVAAVIAHELRHHQQEILLGLLDRPDLREQDANAFAASYLEAG